MARISGANSTILDGVVSGLAKTDYTVLDGTADAFSQSPSDVMGIRSSWGALDIALRCPARVDYLSFINGW